MDWDGTPVLVTGAGGFIGSHLVEALVQAGARVRGFDRFGPPGRLGALAHVNPGLVREVEITTGDVQDGEAVAEAAKGAKVVFHLAAQVSVPYSHLHPEETISTNIVGTLNVLQACRRHEVECLVHTSSCEVYGEPRRVPMEEEHPFQARSPYGATKIGAEMLVESFRRCYGVPAVVLRPFNNYGPRQSAQAVIPGIVIQALAADEVKIGATDVKRDFTFVSDTVAAFLLAAGTGSARGEALNLGSGKATRIGELVEIILRLVGRELPIQSDAARLRPGGKEPTEPVADVSKAKRLLGWSASTALEEGLKRTVDWYREHIAEYRPGL